MNCMLVVQGQSSLVVWERRYWRYIKAPKMYKPTTRPASFEALRHLADVHLPLYLLTGQQVTSGTEFVERHSLASL